MRRIKNFFKETIVWIVVFTLVVWSSSIPFTTFVKNTSAAVDAQYTNDGGATPDVYLDATSTPESIIKITAYDAGGGTLNGITLQLQAGMNCPMGGGACTASPFAVATDLSTLATTTTSGVSLWLDDGDGNFESGQDTLISSTTATMGGAWTTQIITTPYGDTFTVSQTVFSNLGLTIPISAFSPLAIFIAASAADINASTLHKFMPKIPQYGIDVTASISDWPTVSMGQMFGQVTLGTEGGGDNMQQSSPLAISEVQIASSTAAVEFIEIYNKTNQSYDLIPSNGIANADVAMPGNLNLHILDCTGAGCTGTTTNKTLTLTTNNDTGDDIPAKGYFLITSTAWDALYNTPDATYDATADGLAANGGVYISASSTVNAMIIDKVGWGIQTQAIEGMAAVSPPANGSLERKAYPSSTPTSMLGVDANRGNGSDTNNNSGDFITRSAGAAGPQNRTAATESEVISSADRNIVINEILYNTATSSAWIELYNASSTSISINNWTLNVATSTTQIYTIPNVTMTANSFVTIYWNVAGTNDTDTADKQGSLYAGLRSPMSAFGADITLKDGSTIKDYVQYGGAGKAGEAAAVTAGQWTTGDFQPNSTYGQSIARMGTTGDDHNNSYDWMYLPTPTPNLPNTGGDSTSPDAPTNAQLSDPDGSGYGLMGEDVRIAWTPSSISDPSFDRYEIYLLPDGVALNASAHSIYNNVGGQYMWQNGLPASTYSFTGGGFSMSFDSAGNALSTGSYRAYVVAVDMAGNKSAAVASAPATLTSESGGTDSNPPMIDHMPVWQAPTGGNLVFYARMGDDRILATAQLAYKVDAAAFGNATSTCAQPAMAGNTGLYRCSITWNGGWDASTSIQYYLRAIDDAGNDTFLGMYPTDTEATAKSNPVTIDIIAAASWNDGDSNNDLSGFVYDSSGNPVQDAFVIIDGVSTSTATTTASGAFSFGDNNLPEGWQWIRIIKNGFMDISKDVTRGNSGLQIYLSSGFMSNSSGGSSGASGVSWTAPMDGMMMAPLNIACTGDCSAVPMTMGQMPIVISFFNQMNSATIDDMDASNAGSNIYLTADGNTKIAGKVKYAYSASPYANEARFYSDTPLSANTFYTVVITSGVKDTNGNPLNSNRPNGNYEFSFSTMGDNTGMWGGGGNNFSNFGSGGAFMPPFVQGTNPAPGSFNIPTSAAITIEFSEPMDSTSITTTNLKLYKITNVSSWTAAEVTDKSVSVSLDNATKKIVTLTHTALDTNATNSGWYEVRVMGSVKSQLGVWLGNPMNCSTSPDTCLATQSSFSSSFQIGSSADITLPTVAGSYPTNNDGISNNSVVDVAIPSMEIGFSEAINPSTINSQSITLKKGTVSAAGTVKYDSMSNTAKFSPTDSLTSNTVYTLTITTSVTDLSGNALAANNIISFKTGSSDSNSPEVLYANGDDYQIAVTFSEPMNAATQTETGWTTSVLNPANYYINALTSGACSTPGSWSCSTTAVAPYATAGGNQISTLTGVTLSYDAYAQTVTLKGLDMCGNQTYGSCASDSFQIFIDNATDRSGNVITDTTKRAADNSHNNASRNPIKNSAETYGMLGPSGGGMMASGGGPMGGATTNSGPGMDMGKMGMFGGGAFPMNGMAGQTSNYFIDLPVTMALQDGMQIVLTFPNSFNVTGVSKDSFSPVNNDMNNQGGGTVTFDNTFGVGGVASTSSSVITIKLDIATSSTNMLNTTAGPDGFIDFLHFDLKGIINSSVPKSFGTSGYSVNIKTKSSDGGLLEDITTMPFFINQGGSDSLTVVITAPDAGTIASTTTIYLGSPMTGPIEGISTTFINNIATSTFTNLISGQYMFFTDPYITVGTNNYLGKMMPEPITISGAISKAITLEKEGAGAGKAPVTIYLQGNYSTASAADDVDIFANSPSAFRVKTLTDVGSTNPNATFYLTEGSWSIGVGPAMPKGPMAGPVSMPDWMMPANVNVTVGIETATGRTVGTAAIGNTNPVILNVASTNNFQVGDAVTFATGAAAATTTITSLAVNTSVTVTPQGNWSALPAANDTITSVRETSSGDNDKKVFFNIGGQSLMTINGFVLDDSGSGMGSAEVYAYQPQSFGGSHTAADTNGKFTLKITSTGNWTIGAFKPGMPNSQEKSVNVIANSIGTDGNTTADVYLSGMLISDASNNNAGTNPLRLKLKRPAYTISGKVLNSSSQAVPNSPVWAYVSGGAGHSDTMTDSKGDYILYVDNGSWTIEADAPGVGWLQYDSVVPVNGANQSNINLKPVTGVNFYNISGTVTIDGSAQTYMPIRAVKYTDVNSDGTPETIAGREYFASTDANGAYTISAPTGYYRVDIWTPDYGENELDYDQFANSQANLNLSAATTTANITVAAADLQVISLQFNNGTASQNGFLFVEEVTYDGGSPKPTGYRSFTDINGLAATSTIKVKGSTAGKFYQMHLDIPGYGSYSPDAASRALLSNTYESIKVAAAGRAVYFTLPNQTTGTITVAGTVTDGAAVANAWVWISNPSSNFFTGAESGSNGSFSLTVPKLNSGSYKLGADKPDYLSPQPAAISGTASSTSNTITLTAVGAITISGRIYTDTDLSGTYSTSTEAIANAWVWAEETTTGAMTYDAADATGIYSLPVSNGSWKVSAGANRYKDGTYRVNNTKTNVTVTGGTPQTNINIALTSDSNTTLSAKSKSITPSSGGTVDDTATDGTGVKIFAPPYALGDDANSGNLTIQETAAVTETTSAEPLGGLGKTISAADSNGNAINTLGEGVYLDIELVYYKADIDAMDVVDYSKLKNLTASYWDNSLNNWINLSSVVRNAYYKSASTATEWTQVADSATQTGYEVFIDALAAGTTYYDYKLVLTGKTNHLTVFSATQPQDSLYPASPTGLSQSSGSGTSIALSWSAVTTNLDSTAITDLLGYEIYRSTDGSTYTQLNTTDISGTTYTDSAAAWTSYYYKVTAADDGGNETALASSTALQVCSNKTVSNGTVAANCVITCNSGYILSGNSCNSSGGAVIPGGGGSAQQQQQATTTIIQRTQEIITETKKAVEKVAESARVFADKITTIASEAAEVIKANINALLNKFGFKRDLAKEDVAIKKYVKSLIKGATNLTKENKDALSNFIAYGTPTTKWLGESERAGVVNSYKSAFGKFPKTETEWNDAIKIANGRWPSEINKKSEANAETAFKKIYLRKPDKKNPNDNAAVTVMAYGLRPANRNLASEKAAIKTFNHIYGYNPKSAVAWDIVRAIAYSGAKR